MILTLASHRFITCSKDEDSEEMKLSLLHVCGNMLKHFAKDDSLGFDVVGNALAAVIITGAYDIAIDVKRASVHVLSLLARIAPHVVGQNASALTCALARSIPNVHFKTRFMMIDAITDVTFAISSCRGVSGLHLQLILRALAAAASDPCTSVRTPDSTIKTAFRSDDDLLALLDSC